jgi:Kef-type K+ transport system membrane component KefB
VPEVDTERILFELFVIFAVAKVVGELFERLRQPAVIGELLAGMALGTHALGVLHDTEVHHALQELGAVVLLFMVGLDTRMTEVKATGARAVAVGSVGIVLPFVTGFALIRMTDHSGDESAFVGAAMVATSVGITARVLADLGVLQAVESRIILGAAVVDDVLGLLVLAVVSGLSEGNLSPLDIGRLGVQAVAFVVGLALLGHRLVGAAAPKVEAARLNRSELAAALAVCLGLAALAGWIGLAAIVGAFLAGMAFAEIRPRWDLENQVEPVYQLLVPFFFVITGARVDLAALFDPETAGLVLSVTGLAIAGKLLGCGAAAWGMGKRSMAIIGVGMVPRGEVGIIVATVGLSREVVSEELYGVVVAMSILTTLVAPPVLKVLFVGHDKDARRVARGPRTNDIEGIGG